MALEHPERITAIIIQNGNAYEDGIVEEVWAEVVAYDAAPSPETAARAKEMQSEEMVKWQYLHGVPDQSLVSPDAEIRFLPNGHFALETHAAEIAVLVDDFLDRALAR
jgi:hypothetical protein